MSPVVFGIAGVAAYAALALEGMRRIFRRWEEQRLVEALSDKEEGQ